MMINRVLKFASRRARCGKSNEWKSNYKQAMEHVSFGSLFVAQARFISTTPIFQIVSWVFIFIM